MVGSSLETWSREMVLAEEPYWKVSLGSVDSGMALIVVVQNQPKSRVGNSRTANFIDNIPPQLIMSSLSAEFLCKYKPTIIFAYVCKG